MTISGGAVPGTGPAWMSWIGVAAILLGVLFTAQAGNEWMRQLVLDRVTPPSLELPAAECPEDELEEEGISVVECEQLVAEVRSYVVSRPGWFAGAMAWLAAIGTVLAAASVVCGAALANYRIGAARIGAILFAALAVVDAGQFVVAQQAGPILRAIHLPVALLWFAIHLALAMAFVVARRQEVPPAAAAGPVAYGRFEVAGHWILAISVFFLFVSSWWMLALPLPSEVFRYREFPFQLHKNLGITILLLLIAMALIRVMRKQALAAVAAETPAMHRFRLGGHIALYVLIFAVCVTGYMSSSYSGWGTTWWWLVDLPSWGREDEDLNQLYSDLHLWTCWGLLLAMAAHIGAALLHAFHNDGVVRRILRW
jgi:cytochrome b561